MTPSPLAEHLITALEREREANDEKINVNRLISEVASWYEKLRTAMDYRDEEVVVRAAIERILKRRLFFGEVIKEEGDKMAEALVRELAWAGYFPNGEIPEDSTVQVSESIDVHLALKKRLSSEKLMPEGKINSLIISLLSSDIDAILKPTPANDTVANFMFQIIRDSVQIEGEGEETRDAQILLAVRRSFAKDDLPLLRYHLFLQVFGRLKQENLETIVASFKVGYQEMERQLNFKKKDTILNHIKRQTAPFLILYDVLVEEKASVRGLIENDEMLQERVFNAADRRYKGIRKKVRTAVIRSFVFILFTKVLFAVFVEGTFERLYYGHILWKSMAINTTVPPAIMLFLGLFIKAPGKDNSEIIFNKIKDILHKEKPVITRTLYLSSRDEEKSFTYYIFWTLWAGAFLLSFGGIIFILSKIGFNVVSQGIFLFFLTVISFLAYRIHQSANVYKVEGRQSILGPLFDFLFMPIVRVGRSFTESIAQVNILLIIIDFLIEAPFKAVFGFVEQWFFFLSNKREQLG